MFKNDSVGDSRNGFSFIKAYFGEHCPGRHEQDTFPLAGNDARQDKRSRVDWIAQTLGAQKAGATKLGILGSFIGTIIGIFTGLWGLIFMPLLGAAIGEFIDHRDLLKSGKVGFATWLGMMIGIVIKLGLAFTMIGIVIAALVI